MLAHPPDPAPDALAPWGHPDAVWARLRALPPLDDGGSARITAAVAALSALGSPVAKAAAGPLAPDPRDPAVRDAWRAWATNDPWSVRRPWERWFLPSCLRAFRAVLTVRGASPARAREVLAGVREVFVFQLLGVRDAPPGWREIAARAAEVGPQPPLVGLVRALSAGDRATAACCAATRGRWSDTVRLVDPSPEADARGRALATIDPERAHQLALTHAALGLVDAWSEGACDDPTDAHRRVAGSLARSTARARAILVGSTDALTRWLTTMDHPFARTEAATARYAWSWAWQEASRGFPLTGDRPVTPPCQPPAPGAPPWAADQRAAARAWVLLVVLRGRAAVLERWVRTGEGDPDTTWGRLLTDAIPASLRDPIADGARSATYHRARSELSFALDDLSASLSEVIHEVARQDPTARGLRGAVTRILTPAWHPDVPLPAAGFPSMVAAARSWVAAEVPHASP